MAARASTDYPEDLEGEEEWLPYGVVFEGQPLTTAMERERVDRFGFRREEVTYPSSIISNSGPEWRMVTHEGPEEESCSDALSEESEEEEGHSLSDLPERPAA